MYLIAGANGLLGNRLAAALEKRKIAWQGTYCRRPAPGLLPLDITDPGSVDGFFSKSRPEAVFLCANLAGGVDFCQKNPQIGRKFYVDGTKAVAAKAKDAGAVFVFVSTDYVFDGTKGPYREDDRSCPLNLYGGLKLEAEEWIKSNLKDYLIVRTTNIFGWDPQTVTPNYMMQFYRSLKQGNAFNAPSFLWGNPTYAPDLAEAIFELTEKKARGLFHVVGSSFINRYDWAVQAAKIFGFDVSLVKEVKEPAPNMIPRPLRSNLDSSKFRSLYKTPLRDVTQGLESMRKEF